MPHNKKKLIQLVNLLDPALVDRSKNGHKIDLASLFEDVAREYIKLTDSPSASVLNNSALNNNAPDSFKSSSSELSSSEPNSSKPNDSIQNESIQKITDQTLTQRDPLTELPNRLFFSEYVDQAIKRAARHNKPFALVFIDIDHFKTINDTHGHQIGDSILIELAQRIGHSIRESDVLCRLAGDEFCLLVEELDKTDAILRVIDSIRHQLSRPFEHNDLSLIITTSIGVSIYPEDGNNFKDLLHFADLAMYEAKRNGRNSVSIFTPEIAENIRQLNGQQKKLKTALQFNQIKNFVQPELEFGSGAICAIRQIASVPVPGLDSERALLQTAERGNKTALLNIELIRSACEQHRQWQKSFRYIPRLVIPLYQEFLCSARCASVVRELVDRYSLKGSSLEFEVNETDLNSQCDYGHESLKKLYYLGCKISLINFGIGPSSLRLLSSGYIQKIKIDGTLINSIETDKQSRLMMEAIISICRKFKIRVVALDVSSVSQVKLLETLKCDGIRGDFLSPPVTCEEFTDVLATYNRQNKSHDDLFTEQNFLEQKIRQSGIPPQC